MCGGACCRRALSSAFLQEERYPWVLPLLRTIVESKDLGVARLRAMCGMRLPCADKQAQRDTLLTLATTTSAQGSSGRQTRVRGAQAWRLVSGCLTRTHMRLAAAPDGDLLSLRHSADLFA